ncbi:MAG TPA: acyltransferase family protein, partial [Actinotalea sp.]|nr:acyltransferase family protein [Actinotalea sp.]
GYYASLLVSVGLGLLILPEAPHVLRRLGAGLTFPSGFHYVTFFPAEANGPLWSIGLEVVSYVLMPAAMMLLFAWRRRGAARAALWWVGVLALTLAVNQAIITWLQTDEAQKGWQYGVVGGAKEWMPWYSPIGFFGHFMLGIAAAGLIVFVGRWQAGRQSRWFDLGALGFLLAVVVLLWARRSPPEPDLSFSLQGQPYFFPVFPALVAGLLVCTAGSTVVGRVLDNRFARYTAKVSFGISLWHYLVLAVV